MVAWRVANSLEKLLAQLNGMAPWRSKASDGAIGDAAHATRDSDHNPWFTLNGEHLVTARDFTHDPVNGLDCNWLAETLVAHKDNRIKYIIWNSRIISATAPGPARWKWVPYTGPNLHTKHLHLSVVDNATCDDSRAWSLTPYLPLDDDMPSVDEIAEAVKYKVLAGDWRFDNRNVIDMLKQLLATTFTLKEEMDAIRADVAKLSGKP
jgi:hypothetical protein